jgi:hypothetical protein
MTQAPPVERIERAVRHTVSSILGGRTSIDRIVERLVEQGFQPPEIEAILKEAARKIRSAGAAADREFYTEAIWVGTVLLLLPIGLVGVAGYPEHARGVGVLYTGILLGPVLVGYGLIGKIFGILKS